MLLPGAELHRAEEGGGGGGGGGGLQIPPPPLENWEKIVYKGV